MTIRDVFTRPAVRLDRDDHEWLVRFAFLLLGGDPARDDTPEDRLTRAHRIVGYAARWRLGGAAAPCGGDEAYGAARRRVLRHVLRHEQSSRAARLNPFVRVAPPDVPAAADELHAVLGRLSAPARAAYLLVVLDGLTAETARHEIAAVTGGRWHHRGVTAAGERHPVDVAAALDRVDTATGLGRERQYELLAGGGFDPTSPRVLPRHGRRRYLARPPRRRLLASVAVAVVVLLVMALWLYPGYLRNGDVPWDDLVVITQDEWEPGDAGWPIAGDRRGDSELQRAAAKAWYTRAAGDTGLVVSESSPTHWWPRGGENPDEVGVLFAGNVDNTPTVLMYARSWGVPSAGRGVVARYEGSNARHDDPLLTVTAVEEPFEDATMLPLTWDNRVGDGDRPDGVAPGIRFLTPPGMTELHTIPVGPDSTVWREIRVSDRVTDRVDVRARGTQYSPPVCPGGGVLLRGRYADGQGGGQATRYYLYRPPEHLDTPRYPAEVDYESATMAEDAAEAGGGGPLADVRMRSVLWTLGCEGHIERNRQVSSLRFTEVWQGELTRDGPGAAFVRLRVHYVAAPGGRQQPELGLLISDEPNVHYYTEGPHARDRAERETPVRTSLLGEVELDDALLATWWQAPQPGADRWYLVIAGERERVARITVSGDMRREIDGHVAVLRGPRVDESGKVPSVRVTAEGVAAEDGPAALYSVVPGS